MLKISSTCKITNIKVEYKSNAPFKHMGDMKTQKNKMVSRWPSSGFQFWDKMLWSPLNNHNETPEVGLNFVSGSKENQSSIQISTRNITK